MLIFVWGKGEYLSGKGLMLVWERFYVCLGKGKYLSGKGLMLVWKELMLVRERVNAFLEKD